MSHHNFFTVVMTFWDFTIQTKSSFWTFPRWITWAFIVFIIVFTGRFIIFLILPHCQNIPFVCWWILLKFWRFLFWFPWGRDFLWGFFLICRSKHKLCRLKRGDLYRDHESYLNKSWLLFPSLKDKIHFLCRHRRTFRRCKHFQFTWLSFPKRFWQFWLFTFFI